MPTTGEALLQAILQNPEDDVPRLVYADWLEGHGEEARGEFIRHQCELERLPMDSPRRPKLEDRCDDLLAEHEEKWLGSIPASLGEWTFRRGFVESLTLHDETSLEVCGSLFQRHPIRLARLRCGGKAALDLPSSTCQGRLEDLHLVLTTEQEDFFAEARYRPNLSCVTGLCEIDCWDVEMLVALRHLPCAPTLRKLGLWGCDGVGTLEYLLSDGVFPELNTFLIGLDYLGPEDDLAVLTEAGRGDRWQELRIGGRLSRTDMRRLTRCARLQRLELDWQEPMAADPLQLPAALTELCVNDRDVTGSLLPVLARAPGLEMLRSLRLHKGRIG